MRKNVSGQVVCAQMINASTGAAFSGSVTAYVLGDGGTQAAGSVSSGACVSEGNGVFSYAPAQAETNYDHIAFTFIGTGAIPVTVQIYTTFPQTGDNFARLGAPAGSSVSADIAAVKNQTAAIEVDTQDIQSRIPAALVSGRMDSSVGAMAANTLTASALATDAVTEIQTGLSTLDAAGVRSAVGLASANLDTQLDALPTAAEGASAVWGAGTRTLTALDEDSTTLDLDATIRGAVGLASANLDTQLDGLPTAAENTTAVWAAGSRTLTALDEDSTTLDLDSTIRGALGMASADLDTQIDALATASALATVDTVVDAIKVTTDKLDDTLELDGADYRFTANALEEAPSSGVAPTASEIADEVETRTIAAVTMVNGLAANTVNASALASDAVTEIQSGLSTLTASGVRSAVGLASADLDSQLAGIATSADNADVRGERTVIRATVGSGSTTTSIVTGAFSPSGAVADQFKGRIVVFDNDTTTAALRGQATDITASSNSATPTLTVTALTTAPVSSDTFSVL